MDHRQAGLIPASYATPDKDAQALARRAKALAQAVADVLVAASAAADGSGSGGGLGSVVLQAIGLQTTSAARSACTRLAASWGPPPASCSTG